MDADDDNDDDDDDGDDNCEIDNDNDENGDGGDDGDGDDDGDRADDDDNDDDNDDNDESDDDGGGNYSGNDDRDGDDGFDDNYFRWAEEIKGIRSRTVKRGHPFKRMGKRKNRPPSRWTSCIQPPSRCTNETARQGRYSSSWSTASEAVSSYSPSCADENGTVGC